MLTAKVTRKGQVTIPKKIREILKINPDDEVVFVRRGDEVVIKSVKNLMSLHGIVEGKAPLDFDEIRRQVKKEVAQHAASE